MPWAWISVGSNLDREASVRGAVAAMRRRFGDLRLSSVYESTAVGSDGPPFLNLVAGFASEAGVAALNAWLRATEDAFGRIRGRDRFAPRTLDLDLLTYGERVGVVDGCRLPRDEILRYAFVLAPLAEVDPDGRHPENGRRYRELWAEFPKDRPPLVRIPFAFD
ncbi:2-amino-4-hydroxy-6-hydroxymethyldihydropteridine diphosphokinase [Thioalkalicoccus limnaeus]|uniref:2-amino-4-hydroxy-6-hydroxymethyldihydropteridine diphosphokinase n=1 Tax=Thioalkalicoccus limnaeus TaxID=120681 RepID=A0ABV4BD02_9GAMM